MKTNYIPREIEKLIKKHINMFPVVALIGARQTGKTTTLRTILGKQYKFITLDDLNHRRKAQEDPKRFIEEIGDKVIVDEIQYAPELFSYIKIKVDNNPSVKGRYIVTGSQQFLLMKSFSETLAGRIGILKMYPFSIEELKKINKKKDPLDLFYSSCLKGTYPQLVVEKNIYPEIWYNNYIDTYIERDIKTLYNIGNLGSFKNFVHILSDRIGQLLNMNSIAMDIGVALNTIKNWLSILETSNIVYILRPYFANTRKRFIKTPKVYFTDLGIICYLNNINNKNDLMKHKLFGALFENYIIIESLKHFDNYGKFVDLYFIRSHSGTEIDMVINKGDKFTPVEIKASMNINTGMAKNIEFLKANYKRINVTKGFLVTLNEDSFGLTENVKSVSYHDYFKELKKLYKKS